MSGRTNLPPAALQPPPAEDTSGYDNGGQDGYIYDPQQQYYYDGYDQYDETQHPMQEFYYQQQGGPSQGGQQQLVGGQQQQYYPGTPTSQQGSVKPLPGQQQQQVVVDSMDVLPPDQQQHLVQDMPPEDLTANPQAVQLMRTYEFEDWTPPTNGWFADICTETFFSLAFRLHFLFFHYCAGVIIFVLSINYIFATLYRLFQPPDDTVSHVWQSLSYFSIFFVQSFTTVAVYCAGLDMTKAFLRAKRTDWCLFGMSHTSFTKERPPFFIHFTIVGITTIFPFLWAVIQTIAEAQTFFFIAQQYFYIAVVVHMWVVAICFVWFYWLALREKHRAYGRRQKVDDLPEQTVVQSTRNGTSAVTTRIKKSWYHSDVVLEEYGLESRTIAWSCIVFFAGAIPLFSIYVSIARQTRDDTPDSSWVAIGLIFITLLLFLQQFATKKRKPYRAAFLSIFLIILLLVLGLIGCGVAASGKLFGVLIICAIACQAMLLRKRSHQLTRKEICALMNVALDREMEEVKNESRWDTYLCCCRNTLYTYIGCCDVRTYFGYRHPAVREREKQLAVERILLRTDQKVLTCFWFFISLFLVIILGIENSTFHNWQGQVSTRTNVAIPQASSPLPFCSLVYNANGSVQFRTMDLALLTALGYTYGSQGDKDFAQWFSQSPNIIRSYPASLPVTQVQAIDGIKLKYSVYQDVTNGFSVVVVSSSNRGLSFMRNLDRWGESISLQISEIMAPVVFAWPEAAKRSFVAGSSFLKQAYGESDPLVDVSKFLSGKSSDIASGKLLLVGESWCGGYVKILAAQFSVPYVVFNSPGVSYLSSLLNLHTNFASQGSASANGVQISAERSMTTLIDKNWDSSALYLVPCSESVGAHTCGSIEQLVASISSSCGDAYGRGLAAV